MGGTSEMDANAGAPLASDRKSGALGGFAAKIRSRLSDRSDTAVAQKIAGSAFLIRVVNAGIAFASQILLARWMGQSEYGVYVYVWTWVLLLGGLTSLGLASTPQRFIPEYGERGEHALLRGFLIGSRALATGISTVIALAGLLGLWLFAPYLENRALIPLYLAMVCVPMYVLTDVQDGVARSYNWIDVALAPAYFVRPLLILALLGALSQLDFSPTAATAMAATVVATWITSVAQLWMLERRLAKRVPAGPRVYAPKLWMRVSLPIFMVEGFYLLLAYVDVIILSAFHAPHEVAVYYAAVKVMQLVAFVSFSVAAAVAHRFSEYAVTGDQARLSAMVRDAARWTFWPSLAGCVGLFIVGWPILWLFGPEFTEGYPLLFVIAVGLLARATVGPLERLLNMLNEQNLCAAVYGGAFALNVALCFALVPSFGAMGAAVATSITLAIESVLLFWVTRRRLGLGALPWGRAGETAAPARRDMTGDALTDTVAQPLVPADMPFAPEPAAGGPLRFQLSSIEALGEARGAWETLAERSLERNVFAEADFALAGGGLKGGRDVRMAVVWDDAAPEPRLLAALPVAAHRMLPLSTGVASAHWDHFGPLGAPLVDRDRAPEALGALLDGLHVAGFANLLVRFLPEGPTADALAAAAIASGRAVTRVEGHQRALLLTREPEAGRTRQALSSKRFKELRRQLRRIADHGSVSFREAGTPDEVMAALGRFVALEARGWKGRQGSAMSGHADQSAFAGALFLARAEKGEARILELLSGGDTIASGAVLIAGRQAWFYKIAYDEAHARWSPGVQLTCELTARLLDDPTLDRVDSTAVADHPMINRLWLDRLALADVMIALDAAGPASAERRARAERLRRRLREGLAALYRRVREARR